MLKGKELISVISLISSIILTCIKGLAYFVTGSLSLLTETFDSFLDIISVSMSLYAIRISQRPPDKDHPYGHGKFESLVAYTEVIFIAIVAGYIVYELIMRIIIGYTLTSPELGILYIIFTIIVDIFLSIINLHGAKKYDSLALRANYLNYLGDVVRSIVVVIALFSALHGYIIGDIIVTLFLISYLGKEAFEIFRESAKVLLDEAPMKTVSIIEKITLSIPGVIRVKRIRARYLGNGYFIDITVKVKEDLKIDEAHDIADEIENKIKEKIPNSDIIVHIEP